MSGAKRGRKSADGTRAPLSLDEAIQNEILRSNVKYIPSGFFPPNNNRVFAQDEYINRYGLTKKQVTAVVNREPRNELERQARKLIDPHRTQGGGRGEDRGGVARRAAELADYLMTTDGLSQPQALAKAVDMVASADQYPDLGNIYRELRRREPKYPAASDFSALP